MSAVISDYRKDYYQREFFNDFSMEKEGGRARSKALLTARVQRFAIAILPFMGLCAPLRLPLSVGMGALRVWNAEKRVDQGIAVIALANSVFRHSYGQVVTSFHDLFLEVDRFRRATTRQEALESLAKISSNFAYLVLIGGGGLEASLIFLVLQAATHLVSARGKWVQGEQWIEMVADVAMAGVRLHQASGQYAQLKRNWEIEEAIKRVFVGKLGEQWQFPSDHLPVGVEVNGVRVLSWNVMNNIYMNWVTEKDSQGLNGSLITLLDVPAGDTGMTMRDLLVLEMVQNMMERGEVIALQECGVPFLKALEERLTENWGLVKSFSSPRDDQDVLLYDRTKLQYDPTLSETTLDAYPSVPGRPLQNGFFSTDQGEKIRIINAHIPGAFDLPGREEFARYVYDQHQPGCVTLALGDNNFEREEMRDAFEKAGFVEFSLHSNWKTNIDPQTKESKAIDHIFIVGEHTSRDLSPEEVIDARYHLQETVDLLNK